jgi:hypothetical protein
MIQVVTLKIHQINMAKKNNIKTVFNLTTRNTTIQLNNNWMMKVRTIIVSNKDLMTRWVDLRAFIIVWARAIEILISLNLINLWEVKVT